MADFIFLVAAAIGGLAMVICFVRLLIGPTSSDRAVALDGMTIVSIPLIVFFARYLAQVFFIDVALVYALVSFVGIVALARFLERGI